ncbi:MAG: hypothetical protein ACLGI2_08350 [Acidimicrobiia bacterium]
METRVPADEGPWPPARPLGYGAEPAAEPDGELAGRLAAIEQRLDALEGSIRDSVAQEVQGTVDELRRAVSDLGRLLLRDLDRLTKVLADHRDAIVDRLQPMVQAAPGAAEPATETATGVATGAATGAATAAPASEEEPAPLTGEEGRWRALPGRRKRRRSPAAATDGDTSDG